MIFVDSSEFFDCQSYCSKLDKRTEKIIIVKKNHNPNAKLEES